MEWCIRCWWCQLEDSFLDCGKGGAEGVGYWRWSRPFYFIGMPVKNEIIKGRWEG